MFPLRRASIAFLGALVLAWALLAACRSGTESPPALEPAAVATVVTPPANTPESLAAAPAVATATPTIAPTSTTLNSTPTTTPTSPLPSPTRGDEQEHGRYMTPEPPLPTRTARPGPLTPPLTPVPCPTRAADEYVPLMWERSVALPLDISLANAHYAFLPPHDFFIGVENRIGYVRLDEPARMTSDPFSIFVYGFAEIVELPPITDIEAQADSLLYLTGGSRLTVVHTGYLCYLAPVATADFPFPAQDVELDGDRIYVGG